MPTRLETLAILIHEQLADPTVKRLMGRKNLTVGEQPRRIVWIHSPSTVDLPDQAGGELLGENANGERHRFVWLRLENVEIHVFAENEETVEQLFDKLLGAIAVKVPRVRMDGYTWTNDEEGQAGFNERQAKIVLRCAFRLKVSDEQKPLAPVTGTEHNCQLITEETPFDPEPDPP